MKRYEPDFQFAEFYSSINEGGGGDYGSFMLIFIISEFKNNREDFKNAVYTIYTMYI